MKKNGVLAGVFVLVVFLAALILAPTVSASETGEALAIPQITQSGKDLISVTDIPCPMNLPEGEVDGKSIVCGQITVPENWDKPGERSIDITFAIIKARSQSTLADPILYLEGSPGSSSLKQFESLSHYFGKLYETRDFIFYDQRGSTYSGNLECPDFVQTQPLADATAPEEKNGESGDEADSREDDSNTLAMQSENADTSAAAESDDGEGEDSDQLPTTEILPIDQDPQALLHAARENGSPIEEACAVYFAEHGVDLSQYTTANNVRDLAALMKALEYEEYNIYGISYGSRLALELMRTYKQAGKKRALPPIRSVAIDGIGPPNVDTAAQFPLAPMYITMRILGDCEADKACANAYPAIRQGAIDLLAQVAESPLEISSSDGMTETISLTSLTALLSGVAITEGETRETIDYPRIIPYLPLLIEELSQGIGYTYIGLKQGTLPPPDGSQQLAQDEPWLADMLPKLGEQAEQTIATDKMTLSDLFVRDLVQFSAEATTFDSINGLKKLKLMQSSLGEPSPEDLALIVEVLALADADEAALLSLITEMSDEEREETAGALLSASGLKQLSEAIQNQVGVALLCNDHFSRFDVKATFGEYGKAKIPQLIADPGAFITLIARCERYGLTAGRGESSKAVRSGIPSLVVNGGLDAITPAEWGEKAFKTLTNAQLVTIPMVEHGASAKSACGQDIVRSFFTYPGQVADDSCTEALQPSFILPETAMMEEMAGDALQIAAAPAPPAEGDPMAMMAGSTGNVYDRGPNSHASGSFQAPNYTVAWGDTLYSIGQRFGVNAKEIQRANNLSSESIYAGAVLVIPGMDSVDPERPPTAGHYERIEFAPGDIAAARNGLVYRGQPQGYILSGRKGQIMEINTRSSGEPLSIVVEDGNGRRLNLNGQNRQVENNLWLNLPHSGDYVVIVKPTTFPESPELRYGITFVIQ